MNKLDIKTLEEKQLVTKLLNLLNVENIENIDFTPSINEVHKLTNINISLIRGCLGYGKPSGVTLMNVVEFIKKAKKQQTELKLLFLEYIKIGRSECRVVNLAIEEVVRRGTQ